MTTEASNEISQNEVQDEKLNSDSFDALTPCRNIKGFGQMRKYQKILILVF